MSIWSRIVEAVGGLTSGEGLTAVFEKLRTPPERRAGFAIAVIALGAKMAKADGQVTRDEVTAFREVFHIPKSGEASAARIFDLARTDVAGFEQYAQKVRGMFPEGDQTLEDLVEGLLHIAIADGIYHPGEDAFLRRVSEIFGLAERDFLRLRAYHVPEVRRDPYEVLGVEEADDLEDIRTAWRALVRSSHPDAMIARGVPEEAIKLAEKRLIVINRAWEEIQAERA